MTATGAGEVAALLRAFCLSGLRALASRARAAAVLLQQALRRLPRLPRPGHPAEVNPDLILGDPPISILEGVVLPWGEPIGYLRKAVLPTLARALKFDLDAPWSAHTRRGAEGAPARRSRASSSSPRDGSRPHRARGGVGGHAQERRAALPRIVQRRGPWAFEEFMVQPCQTCGGRRLKPESLAVLVAGKSIGDVVDLPVERAVEFFDADSSACAGRQRAGLDADVAGPILKEVSDRLRFLRDVGLDYLTLGRARGIPLRRRGAADPPGHPDRLAAGRRALHPRRAEHRPAPARQRAPARHAQGAARPRQHGHRRGARRGHHPRRGPCDRPGPARRPVRRRGGGRGDRRRRSSQHPTSLTARYLRGELRIPVPGGAARWREADQRAAHRRRPRQQPEEPHGGHAARPVRGGHRRLRLRQVDAWSPTSSTSRWRATSTGRGSFRARTRGSRAST